MSDSVANDGQATNLPHVVIVGGGFAGLEAAKRLANKPVRVTLFDRSNHFLFQPLLYQVATAALSPADIASPIRSILRRARNIDVLMAEVQDVISEQRKVVLDDGSVSYDYLILATGATHSYFGKEEWAPLAPGLKSVADATRVRSDILTAFEMAERTADPEQRNAWLTFVVVGGGPTGVEMAGAMAELAKKALKSDFRHIDPTHARIVLVEAGPRILPSFDESLARKAQTSLENIGVEVRVGSKVELVQESHVIVNGEQLPTYTVTWAAGVQASPVARWLKVEHDRSGRVAVNPDCSVPERLGVFVIGDAMSLPGADGKPLPGVAQVAMQTGRYVAAVILAASNAKSKPGPFRYKDKGSLATIGRNSAVGVVFGRKVNGLFAWLIWVFIHLVSLTGYRNKLIVMIQWAWAYVTWERGVRLITMKEQPIKANGPLSANSSEPATESVRLKETV